MAQLQLFTPAELAGMRDRTKARNYSPEAENFRRVHEGHREWGLRQRYARKARRLANSTRDVVAPTTTSEYRTDKPPGGSPVATPAPARPPKPAAPDPAPSPRRPTGPGRPPRREAPTKVPRPAEKHQPPTSRPAAPRPRTSPDNTALPAAAQPTTPRPRTAPADATLPAASLPAASGLTTLRPPPPGLLLFGPLRPGLVARRLVSSRLTPLGRVRKRRAGPNCQRHPGRSGKYRVAQEIAVFAGRVGLGWRSGRRWPGTGGRRR